MIYKNTTLIRSVIAASFLFNTVACGGSRASWGRDPGYTNESQAKGKEEADKQLVKEREKGEQAQKNLNELLKSLEK